jgi:DNA-binding NtrC family response regulator
VSLSEIERELVLEALRRTGYVQKGAAELLGISRRKLNYMIQRMGITHSAWRRNRDQSGDSGCEQEPRVAPSSENP